jgi:hypothetical protein
VHPRQGVEEPRERVADGRAVRLDRRIRHEFAQ